YMLRALQLARYGSGFVSPNPMVGAVVVSPDGRIIGEGWHRKFGGPHAEVNAMASIHPENEHLIKDSTIYVTLEPCSHYGKTPPCSLLLINKGIKRVVVGSPDPFPLVSGRGIKMLREAGIEVIENFMQEECDSLNRRFITAHTLSRPYILLKWAQSRDGYMALKSDIAMDAQPTQNLLPIQISTPVTAALMHTERALYDAILVGTNTVIIDNPTLTTRHWPGSDPTPVTFNSPNLPQDSHILSRPHILLDPSLPLSENLSRLYKDHSITSLMVEGGARTLTTFITQNLFDELRIEISSQSIHNGLLAPSIPSGLTLLSNHQTDSHTILTFLHQ
ncbi:MAG: bifunctional diaminohydroxyphosphoribosylaminopyrimidine deaminase/5-amino-6-(5-phosphoribosylamino)uracil reductase RibD, partial [Muribaculaceae bacterium]|nr:bifunctional diaminohydroxyphosphoribosylaminopyrimidine deaminase/5-amino-6-(5-phosphoribosylamino)uracil reductase RibD [Muribaculaceae bacterium]